MTDKFLAAIISSVDQIPYVQQPRHGSVEAQAWWGEQSSPEGWQAGRETGLGVLEGFQEVGGEGLKPVLETCAGL